MKLFFARIITIRIARMLSLLYCTGMMKVVVATTTQHDRHVASWIDRQWWRTSPTQPAQEQIKYNKTTNLK
jgi:hypothetical protein